MCADMPKLEDDICKLEIFFFFRIKLKISVVVLANTLTCMVQKHSLRATIKNILIFIGICNVTESFGVCMYSQVNFSIITPVLLRQYMSSPTARLNMSGKDLICSASGQHTDKPGFKEDIAVSGGPLILHSNGRKVCPS